MESDLISITHATYLGNSNFRLKFSDNTIKIIDINKFLSSNLLYYDAPIFQPLKNEDFLKNFKVDYTICWNDDIDIAPELLYNF